MPPEILYPLVCVLLIITGVAGIATGHEKVGLWLFISGIGLSFLPMLGVLVLIAIPDWYRRFRK
jgi:hypothetical protein